MSIAVLAACSPAGADRGATGARVAIAAPKGWREEPQLATAVAAAAKADGVTIDGTSAWAEPAMGCYAAALELHAGSATAAVLADQIVASITGVPGASTSDVAKPIGDDGVLALGFAKAPYTGRLRAHLGAGRVAAIACFANQREPAACATACTQILQGVP